MPITRSTVIRGPAIIKHAGATFLTQGDVTVALHNTQFNVDVWGQAVDKRLDDVRAEIQFTPIGVFSDAMRDALLPWIAAMPGTSMFGATDLPTVIHGTDDREITFHATAVTTQPELNFAANAQLWGQTTITALRATGKGAAEAGSFYTEVLKPFPTDVNLGLDDVITMHYDVSWGSTAPWDDIALADGGIKVAFDLQTQQETCDELGTFDYVLQSILATATFTPIHGTLAQLLAMTSTQGAGAVRGASLRPKGNNLVIDGGIGNPICTLNNALPAEVLNLNWGNTSRRPGEIALQSVRSFANGAFTPVLTLVEKEAA